MSPSPSCTLRCRCIHAQFPGVDMYLPGFMQPGRAALQGHFAVTTFYGMIMCMSRTILCERSHVMLGADSDTSDVDQPKVAA